LDLLLEDPHVDPGLAVGQFLTVAPHEGRNGRSPITAPDYAYALRLFVTILRVGIKLVHITTVIVHGDFAKFR
jgi:hypothetical protein